MLATAFMYLFVAKYSGVNGGLVWAKTLGGSGSERGNGVVVDVNNDVIVTGNFTNTVDFGNGGLTSAGSYDIFVAKYSGRNGAAVWSKRFGGATSDSGMAIAIDSASDLMVTGIFSGLVGFGYGPLTSAGADDIFLLKILP